MLIQNDDILAAKLVVILKVFLRENGMEFDPGKEKIEELIQVFAEEITLFRLSQHISIIATRHPL